MRRLLVRGDVFSRFLTLNPLFAVLVSPPCPPSTLSSAVSPLLKRSHLFTLISFMSTVFSDHLRGCETTLLCHRPPHPPLSHRLVGGGWGAKKKVASSVLVISQCPPPSRWTTSGKSQHLDQQGGLAITAAAALLLRNLLTNLCVRSSYDL